MRINNHMIFVHLEKTGGTWVDQVLHFYPALRPTLPAPRGHAPLKELPEIHWDKPALAFVRNPWDWYVSRFAWKRRNIDQNLYEWSVPEKYWTDNHKHVYRTFKNFETSIVENESFTTYFHRMTDHVHIPLHPKRMEDGLGEGIISFCDEVGIAYMPALLSHIDTKPPANVNPHAKYHTFYNNLDLRALVAERDAELIERFNYSFE